ncbi:glycoside hydrolase 5 family protein [Pontibacter arcticus]|uniref:hypothetical protein n=1 Tax=Pontibacter arcticus TaxID=2080288 RepID=UPI001EF0700C|nr:hypothetical protein [Pontibacter arcticus]
MEVISTETEDQLITLAQPKKSSRPGIARMQPFALENDLPWIQVAPDAPYFITESGENWTPIGQNDAITWPDFEGLFRRKNLAQVEGHLAWLAGKGVTCLRLMLEYAQHDHSYFERPAGNFSPNMVQLWDDLFKLCAKYNMRILLTPFDTFWMWIRWKHHPYNAKNGGPCKKRSGWLFCPNTMEAVKNRLTFVVERWGGSGVLFGWDLWNEIHPAYAGGRTDNFFEVIQELSQHVRTLEMSLYGKSHPQTVSLFGPVLDEHPTVADVIFRHPMLDFASTHFYDAASINKPKETVLSAICTGKLVREAINHLQGNRPFFDSEHGPIQVYKTKQKMLPEAFDDEYFRHIQWAHLAAGGAGGGMRWPYRQPHTLTHGMREAQKSMAGFIELIDWKNFRRKNLNEEVKLNSDSFAAFACADDKQAILWLLRKDATPKNKGLINPDATPIAVSVTVPGMMAGDFKVTLWNTLQDYPVKSSTISHLEGGDLILDLGEVKADIAVALTLEN